MNESREKYALGMFVEFKGAFNNILWEWIAARLHRFECEEACL